MAAVADVIVPDNSPVPGDPLIELRQASVCRDGVTVLGPLDLRVCAGERWVVLGSNGAGKTTLVGLCAGNLQPSAGDVRLLGESIDDADLDELLPQIGWSSAALADQISAQMLVIDAVVTALEASLMVANGGFAPADLRRAADHLARVGCRDLAERAWGTLSEGERKRVLLARALMCEPEILLLDEPAAGLDLGGREALLRQLARLARDPAQPAIVVVSHHVEEIPPGFTHALLLRDGAAVAAGPIEDVITSRLLSAAFGIPVVVSAADGRFFARSMLAPVF